MILKHHPDRALLLRGGLVGAACLVLIALLPASSSVIVQVGMLLAVWLCLAVMLAVGARQRSGSERPRVPTIPLRFSGPMGRFTLRTRGDRRHVEIVSEGVVLAEVKATDLRDEIELIQAVPSEQLEDLGSALGQAIDIALDADDAHLDWDDHGASEEWDTDRAASTRW